MGRNDGRVHRPKGLSEIRTMPTKRWNSALSQRLVIIALTACILSAYVCFAQSQTNGTPDASSPPQLTRFSLDNLDPKRIPAPIYQYACGGWMASHPIPEDQVLWDTFSALQDRNEALLRSIAEQSKAADPKRDSTHQKIGDYYAGRAWTRPALTQPVSNPSRQNCSTLRQSTVEPTLPRNWVIFTACSIFLFKEAYFRASLILAVRNRCSVSFPIRIIRTLPR